MYLIKFNFTNRNHIPDWVEEATRKSDTEIDAYRALSIKATQGFDGFKRGKSGLLRDGRVDTGLTPGQREFVTAGYLHKTMAVLDHGLVNVHWHLHQRPGKMTKFVLVLAYEEKMPSMRLKPAQVKDLQFFQQATWNYCWLYINPEDEKITLNFTKLIRDQEPRLKIGYNEHRSLAFLPVEARAVANTPCGIEIKQEGDKTPNRFPVTV